MFQASELSNRNSIPEELSIGSLKDQILSLTHRLNSIEHILSSKMDRQQCLTLLQRKTNNTYLKKVVQELKQVIGEQKRKEQESFKHVQDQHTKSIKNLMQKLNHVNFKKEIDRNTQQFNVSNNRPIFIKPQELYLESNETMFSMIIEQVNKLRNSQNNFEKVIETKHKNAINLNNEVCRKIDKLQNQINNLSRNLQEQVLTNSNSKHLNTSSSKSGLNNNFSQSDCHKTIHNTGKKASQPSHYQQSVYIGNQQFQTIKIDNLSKNLQNVQKQMVNKVNIKDVIPIIKKNSGPLQEQLCTMKSYMEESLQSMRKILLHQSQINEQLCGAIRVGWWQSVITGSNSSEQVIWDKELINMYPEGFLSKKSNTHIQIAVQGTYLVAVYFNCYYGEDQFSQPVYLLVDDQKIEYTEKRVLRLDKNSKLGVRSRASENYLCIQKL